MGSCRQRVCNSSRFAGSARSKDRQITVTSVVKIGVQTLLKSRARDIQFSFLGWFLIFLCSALIATCAGVLLQGKYGYAKLPIITKLPIAPATTTTFFQVSLIFSKKNEESYLENFCNSLKYYCKHMLIINPLSLV